MNDDDDDVPMNLVSVELPHNRSQQSINQSNDENDNEDDVSFDFDESLSQVGQTSTPTGSLTDLSDTLRSLKPYPRAPPRKPATRGRKPQKSTILTADQCFGEVAKERDVKKAKEAAAAKRKSNAEAKKKLLLRKRLLLQRKKWQKVLLLMTRKQRKENKPK